MNSIYYRCTAIAVLASVALLSGCADKHARTDIALEMTDEDSVEAIIDEDLLTAGGTIVDIEEEAGARGTESTVSYVDEVDMQTPTVIEPDPSLRPDGGVEVTEDEVSYEEPGMMTGDNQYRAPVTTEDIFVDTVETDEIVLDDDGDEYIVDSVDVEEVESVDDDMDDYLEIGDAMEMTDEELDAEAALPAQVTEREDDDESTPVDTTLVTDISTDELEGTAEDGGDVVETAEDTIDEIIESETTEVVIEDEGDIEPAVARPPGGSAYVRRTRERPVTYPRYTVRRGDTLWSISRDKGCSISDLCAANNITRSTILKIGQDMVIPIARVTEDEESVVVESGDGVSVDAGEEATEEVVEAPPVATRMYTVQEGDSYWKIAKRYSINYLELMALNDTTNPMLHPGDTILVPEE